VAIVMKKNTFFNLFLGVLLFPLLGPACKDKPTEPKNSNPLDPYNQETDGDPFVLKARIANGGITLSWNALLDENCAGYYLYRSQNDSIYTRLTESALQDTFYIDQEVENGHSYWYQVTALDKQGRETDRTNTAVVNINTDPVLVINGGDEYTESRSVSLTILALTAQEIMLANSSDFADAVWESYVASKDWMLASGPGEKTVYLKVRYENDAESAVISAAILPMPMDPTMVIGSDTAVYCMTREVQIVFAAKGTNLQMLISEDSTFADAAWQTYADIHTFQLSEGDGAKSVYVKIKNDFEIVSQILKDIIILDTTPPVPDVSVTPESGVTNETQFQFDATACCDNIAPAEALQVRFDYDNDDTFDTDWLSLASYSYCYTVGGGDKTVNIEVKDCAGWVADTTVKLFVNTRPQGVFTAIPDANNYLQYAFDASGSSDYEDGQDLDFRWDFEGDGSWDTDWSAQHTINHVYSHAGNYAPSLSVCDRHTLSMDTSLQVDVFPGTASDIDGNVYHTVIIGAQEWMAENLKVTHYRNGDSIPEVRSQKEWFRYPAGAFCNYRNETRYVVTYGRLYNYNAVMDERGLAPEGWHVATDAEWRQLEQYLGMSQEEAGVNGLRGTDQNIGGKLKESGYIHWYEPNTGATNESGFTALPGGYRQHYTTFIGIRKVGVWWCAHDVYTPIFRMVYNDNSGVERGYEVGDHGASVRCIKD
jgi:uncharacterized protein (TIGR02145 family)